MTRAMPLALVVVLAACGVIGRPHTWGAGISHGEGGIDPHDKLGRYSTDELVGSVWIEGDLGEARHLVVVVERPPLVDGGIAPIVSGTGPGAQAEAALQQVPEPLEHPLAPLSKALPPAPELEPAPRGPDPHGPTASSACCCRTVVVFVPPPALEREPAAPSISSGTLWRFLIVLTSVVLAIAALAMLLAAVARWTFRR